MTGPEHYHEAEQHIETADNTPDYGSDQEKYHLAAAQVHATLALVATRAPLPLPPAERYAWQQVIR